MEYLNHEVVWSMGTMASGILDGNWIAKTPTSFRFLQAIGWQIGHYFAGLGGLIAEGLDGDDTGLPKWDDLAMLRHREKDRKEEEEIKRQRQKEMDKYHQRHRERKQQKNREKTRRRNLTKSNQLPINWSGQPMPGSDTPARELTGQRQHVRGYDDHCKTSFSPPPRNQRFCV